MNDYIVEMKNISKSFPGVRALSDVNLRVRKGEVHALVGENGAGKSTLIKILTGAYQKDEGAIVFDGKPVDIKGPHYSKRIGIQAVYQDITLATHLSVGENFFLGNLPLSSPITVDWKRVYSKADELLASLDLRIDSKTLLKDLPVAKQEMVAIAKAMHEKSKLMIFDEPTALLANEECEELYKIIDRLKRDGIGIIYISHRMEEIFRVCDAVTVLKDGHYVAVSIGETDEITLISDGGRKIEEMYSIDHHADSEVVLKVKNLSRKRVFENINFDLHRGEILGMFGLVGSGRTDIVSAIFGATEITGGEIEVFGKKERIRKPRDAIKLGIGLLPENRRTQGLALPLSVKINTNVAIYAAISKFGLINHRRKRQRRRYVRRWREKPSIESGCELGEIRKVVIASAASNRK